MNFSQLHERLRNKISHRINRGVLDGSTLATQAKLKPSHISNFLHRRRRLSLDALDRVLEALSLTIYDLMPAQLAGRAPSTRLSTDETLYRVPLVSPATAIDSPIITLAATLALVPVPASILEGLRPRRSSPRRSWQRFVAVRTTPQDAVPMSPILQPQSIVILDRQYNSLVPYQPPQPNIYAINNGADALIFRYASLDAQRLVLRPHSIEYPIELLEVGENASPSDVIIGRVCLCISTL